MTYDCIIQGMTILRKYIDNPSGYATAAEHDQFFVNVDKKVSKTDKSTLKALGWSISEFDGGEELQWMFNT